MALIETQAALVAALEVARTRKGISHFALTNQAGVTSMLLQRILHGEVKNMRFGDALALANVLGLELDLRPKAPAKVRRLMALKPADRRAQVGDMDLTQLQDLAMILPELQTLVKNVLDGMEDPVSADSGARLPVAA